MGGPGAGKGTQCGKLLKKYPQLDSFSTGDLLRAKKKEDSEEARALAKTMAEGKLVTSSTVVKLMRDYMGKSRKNIFLADGFPRSQENVDEWNKQLGDKVDVRFLLLFDLDGETMLKRLLYRASKSAVKRDDDKEEVMRKRIALFENSRKIFQQFDDAGNLRRVSATGSISCIFNRVETAFAQERLIKPKPKVIFVMGGPGAGKGTQCNILLNKYPNLDSFSTGDLLRAKAKEDSPMGREIAGL